jgi:hypothetical protein
MDPRFKISSFRLNRKGPCEIFDAQRGEKKIIIKKQEKPKKNAYRLITVACVNVVSDQFSPWIRERLYVYTNNQFDTGEERLGVKKFRSFAKKI